MFRRKRNAPDGGAFEDAIAAIEATLSPAWQRGRQASGSWIAATTTPERLGVQLSGLGTAVRVQAVLYGVDVPPSAHANMTLFCAAANRFFTGWNLYLAPSADVERDSSPDIERVVSAGTFLMTQDDGALQPELIKFLVLTAIRVAVVAAPAVRAALEGGDTREAVALADRYDDTIGWSDVVGRDGTIAEAR